jgi:hypothetical protein
MQILSSGSYLRAELYDFTLASGQTYHFTSFMVPLTASIYSPAAGPFTYQTGLTIKRDTNTQKAGTEAGNMKLTVSPQPDSPRAPVLINGYPFLQAVRLGFFDNAVVQMSKLYMWPPYLTNGIPDPSPGAVGFFKGQVQDAQAGRVTAQITVNDYLALLGSQNMPRQLFGVGCYHQVYDAGCGLLRAAFTVTGSVTGATDGAHFSTSLTQADDYFDLGVITFTSGLNSGFAQTVAQSKNAAGAIATRYPFPKAPAVGDTFSVYPGCDLQQATCSGKFNNLLHFGGQPYIPDPSTIVDGDTQAPPAQPQGSQAGLIVGSQPSSQANYGNYKT